MIIILEGKEVDVLNKDCIFRPCFHFFVDKGTYTIGRGYTSYYDKEKYCCGTRKCHGCPSPIPGTTEESRTTMAEDLRCCPEPKFAKEGKRKPRSQKCLTCGTKSSGLKLELLKTLKRQEGKTNCKHENVCDQTLEDAWGQWRCSDCEQYFQKKPKPFEVGEKDYKKFLDIIFLQNSS